MKQPTKRIPRPKGLTELRHLEIKEPTDKNKQNTLNLIINHYINTGYQYCNRPYNIEQFSELTGIPVEAITKGLITQGNTLYNIMDTEAQSDLLRVIFSLAFKDSLTDRSRALQQYSVLVASQGNSYKPFISAEVTKALKLTLDSSAQMQNLIKIITASGPSVIINNTNAQQTNHGLTIEEAHALIQEQTKEKAPLLENPKAREALLIEHELLDMPEVDARKQQGIDTGKEGLNINKIAQLQNSRVDDGPKAKSHIDRRAQQLEIDPNSDEV